MSRKIIKNIITPTTSTSNNDSFVVNLAEVKIPEFNPHQVRFSPNKWVNYGDTNLFPDFLMKSVKKSPVHSAFINLRENFIKGAGISYSDNIKDFMENLDGEGTTIEELIEDIAGDLSPLETFACFVRYNKKKTIISAIDYVDSSKVRPAKIEQTPEEIEAGEAPKIKGYWISADWNDTNHNKPVFYQRFNTSNIDETTQLYFYHKRANGQPYLPEVTYASCLNYVQMEYEISKFGLNHMLNGFFGSAILTVAQSMPDDMKSKFKREIQNNFIGSENASRLLVRVSENADDLKITPLSTSDNTPMLVTFSNIAESAICTAHRAQPVLAGIQSEGSNLGSDGKLIKTAQELFQNNVIVHLQKPILSFLKKVLRFNGVTDYTLNFQTLNLVSEDIPDWFIQDYVKPEVLGAKYGYKPEDLVSAPVESAPIIETPII